MTSQSSSAFGGSHNDMSDHYGYALPSTVHIKILRKGTIIADEKRECQFGTTEIVTIKVMFRLNKNNSLLKRYYFIFLLKYFYKTNLWFLFTGAGPFKCCSGWKHAI